MELYLSLSIYLSIFMDIFLLDRNKCDATTDLTTMTIFCVLPTDFFFVYFLKRIPKNHYMFIPASRYTCCGCFFFFRLLSLSLSSD